MQLHSRLVALGKGTSLPQPRIRKIISDNSTPSPPGMDAISCAEDAAARAETSLGRAMFLLLAGKASEASEAIAQMQTEGFKEEVSETSPYLLVELQL